MTSPLIIALAFAGLLALLCWVASLFTRDHSWVDRLWSIAPVLHAFWFAVSCGRFDARVSLMALLVGAWGVRLTYNFARKGGYRAGGEDYRWPVLRARMNPWLFALFNVVFICAIQHALLLLLALPVWVAATQPAAGLNALDALATGLFVAFLIGETIADQQQWRFQVNKHARRASGETVASEFLTTGLFRDSRHPNFLCEQGLWWALYLFGVAAGGGALNVSIAGPLLLTLLFQGSTAFTESITLSRYPAYADYQRRVGRLLPVALRRVVDQGVPRSTRS